MQPIPEQPTQPVEPQPKPRATWADLTTGQRIAALVVLGLIFACIIGCCAVGLGNVGAQSTAAQQHTSATSTPIPQDYRHIVAADANRLGADFDGITNVCPGAGDIAACRAALVTFDDDVHRFQADLATHPAPACLKTADTHIRAGLAHYDKGAQADIAGIDATDAASIDRGNAEMSAGTADMTQATVATSAAKC